MSSPLSDQRTVIVTALHFLPSDSGCDRNNTSLFDPFFSDASFFGG